jgi:hypothetical protein
MARDPPQTQMLAKSSACRGVEAGIGDRRHGAEAEAVAAGGRARGGVCGRARGGAIIVALAGGAFAGEVVRLDGEAEGVFGRHGGREAEGAGGEGVDVGRFVVGRAVGGLAFEEGDEAGDGHCCSDGWRLFGWVPDGGSA